VNRFVNDPERWTDDAVSGFELLHRDAVRVDRKHRIVTRRHLKKKVAVVAGGGAGHEPLHSGFVGEGMLDAAVIGEVFTSPTSEQIVRAVRAVEQGPGTLLIVKNYSGDVMNFEMAREQLTNTRSVFVADDVMPGQRGLGGAVFVEKIAGAAAETGSSLGEVTRLARKTAERVRSVGVALGSCTHPAAHSPTFDIGPDDMEFGVGIHGETGSERRPLGTGEEIAQQMLDAISHSCQQPLVLLSGLGATPMGDLQIVYREIARQLQPARALVGNYVTALDMNGITLTVLDADEELLRFWDFPVNTPALKILTPSTPPLRKTQ
jgi:dihydroxyacetone kinase-like protein